VCFAYAKKPFAAPYDSIGRRVFGLMTLIREITYGLDIIVRPHLPQ
jgi:hypothetical protein